MYHQKYFNYIQFVYFGKNDSNKSLENYKLRNMMHMMQITQLFFSNANKSFYIAYNWFILQFYE